MNFNQGSNKTFQAGSWWYDVSQRKGWVPQNAIVAITAYSCITSSIPNHASFISNFSKPREEKPAEDSQRRIHRSAARATVSGALEEKWKKKEKGEKKNSLGLEEKEYIPLRLEMAEHAWRRPKPCCAPWWAPYCIHWRMSRGEIFSGNKMEARANLKQKKKKKSLRGHCASPVVLRAHTNWHI